MLASQDVVAFIPSANPEAARPFYEGVLGLKWLGADPFAAVLDANGTTLRIANVSSVPGFKPAPFTVLGWRVDDIDEVVAGLARKGVKFEHYDGLGQDDAGVWTSPAGARVAWFKDPDGNVLSVAELDTRTKAVVSHIPEGGKLIEIAFDNAIPVRASHR
jgi:catechol 2,3-dioxygenase-like lactoylglutathione lyase family enzyme